MSTRSVRAVAAQTCGAGPDAVIHRLAAQQHGIVARRQLRSAGLSPDLVDHRVRTRRLRPVHAGVYVVGPVPGARATEMAAVLACADSTLSHGSAAAILELLPRQDEAGIVHVTIPPERHGGRRAGICAHRSRLAHDEVTRFDGIPVTTAARTLIDLGPMIGARELEQALAQAERLELLKLPDLAKLLERYPNRPGTRCLRRILTAGARPAFTRSEAEERLLSLIRGSGLPVPETNVRMHRIEVDFYWRRARFAVEVDGYAHHGSHAAFIRDCQRDAALAAAGVQVLRLSWHQIVREPRRTLVQLAQALTRAAG